jgi:hypothetical protein
VPCSHFSRADQGVHSRIVLSFPVYRGFAGAGALYRALRYHFGGGRFLQR